MAYGYYIPRAIDPSLLGASTLTNFTFPVQLAGSAIPELKSVAHGGLVQSASGFDLGFRSADLSTPWHFQLRFYDPVSGDCSFWVQAFAVSPTANTYAITLGDASITTDQSSLLTWDHAIYDAVVVAAQTGGGTAPVLSDLTGQVTPTAINSPLLWGNTSLGAGTGLIQLVAASAQSISLGTASVLDQFPFTKSVWVSPASLTAAYQCIVGRADAAATTHCDLFLKSTGQLACYFGGGGSYTDYDGSGSHTLVPGSSAFPGAMYRLTITGSATNGIRGYVNGVLDGSAAYFSGSAPTPNAGATVVGDDTFTAGRDLDGYVALIIDQKVECTADWLLAEYNSQVSASAFSSGTTVVAAPAGIVGEDGYQPPHPIFEAVMVAEPWSWDATEELPLAPSGISSSGVPLLPSGVRYAYSGEEFPPPPAGRSNSGILLLPSGVRYSYGGEEFPVLGVILPVLEEDGWPPSWASLPAPEIVLVPEPWSWETGDEIPPFVVPPGTNTSSGINLLPSGIRYFYSGSADELAFAPPPPIVDGDDAGWPPPGTLPPRWQWMTPGAATRNLQDSWGSGEDFWTPPYVPPPIGPPGPTTVDIISEGSSLDLLDQRSSLDIVNQRASLTLVVTRTTVHITSTEYIQVPNLIQPMKVGDRRPPLVATLGTLDENGNIIPHDLTGCTVVVNIVLGNKKIVTGGPVAIVNAASGQVQYNWGLNDIAQVGDYDGEFKATDASGLPLRYPDDCNFIVKATAQVGP